MPVHSSCEATRIAVVDDDARIRSILRASLESEGYQVTEASSGRELLRILDELPISLVTLDLRLRREDGLHLMRMIRERFDTAIILITGKSEPVDRVLGLELGADDYISKPFYIREVTARIKAVLRRWNNERTGEEVTTTTSFSGWSLVHNLRELSAPNGNSCPLTEAEYKLLGLFLDHPHQVLSREVIMTSIKGQGWFGNDRFVDNQVGRLRRKMASICDTEGIIRNVRGSGYVLASQVVRTATRR